MKTVRLLLLASASLLSPLGATAQFAAAVVAYEPGLGVPAGFANPAAALGAPSRVTPGTFGGPVSPFNPPFLASQLVSIGEGGALTVQFKHPVLNHPHNRFGIDFIIFGNAGFIVTNELDFTTFEWIGIPATDGSLFGHNPGVTRVLVSRDGVTFYELNPARPPVVDTLLPTDGAGDFHTPADPTLTAADFAGLSESEIRALYHDSAGGAGYDLEWAQDASGRPVHLPEVRFVRVEVVSGRSDVDGFAAVFVPPGRR